MPWEESIETAIREIEAARKLRDQSFSLRIRAHRARAAHRHFWERDDEPVTAVVDLLMNAALCEPCLIEATGDTSAEAVDRVQPVLHDIRRRFQQPDAVGVCERCARTATVRRLG